MREKTELLSVTENPSFSYIRYFNNRAFSDIKITTETKSFYAHKALLSARSEYLREYFNRHRDQNEINFSELLEEKLADNLPNEGESIILWCLLQYIYTDKIHIPKNDHLMLPLYEIVKKLKLQNYTTFIYKKFFTSKKLGANEYKVHELNSLSTQLKELYYYANINPEKSYRDTCDLVIRVKDVLFFTHKSILCFKSKFFRKMIHGGWREGNEITPIDISFYSPILFQTILYFIYSGEVNTIDDAKNDFQMIAHNQNLDLALNYYSDDSNQSETDSLNFNSESDDEKTRSINDQTRKIRSKKKQKEIEQLLELIYFGEYFLVGDLVEYCEDILQCFIDDELAFDLWDYAEDQFLSTLSQRCEKYIALNFKSCSLNDQFFLLSKSKLQRLLNSGFINIPLEDVFQRIRSWGSQNLHLSPTASLNEVIFDLLPPYVILNDSFKGKLLSGFQQPFGIRHFMM